MSFPQNCQMMWRCGSAASVLSAMNDAAPPAPDPAGPAGLLMHSAAVV